MVLGATDIGPCSLGNCILVKETVDRWVSEGTDEHLNKWTNKKNIRNA